MSSGETWESISNRGTVTPEVDLAPDDSDAKKWVARPGVAEKERTGVVSTANTAGKRSDQSG